jgi:hypothetical protein
MSSSTKRALRTALFTSIICAAAGSLAITGANAAHHVKRHWHHGQTYHQYQPASDTARFPKTIDDFNVNGGS